MQMEKSGCGPFDRSVERYGVYTGNVVSDHQVSWLVRPASETECNGRTFRVGVLQDADLRHFGSGSGGPRLDADDAKVIREAVNNACGGYLYRLQHLVRTRRPCGEWYRRRVVHGYVLARRDDTVLFTMVRPSTGAKHSRGVVLVFANWLKREAERRAVLLQMAA
ncbi:MAG TPA: hypothetical protein VFQ88_07275 [Nevskiaceae bacterium]|nr:hypothetical protein [Nevskiaceae bacterium]